LEDLGVDGIIISCRQKRKEGIACTGVNWHCLEASDGCLDTKMKTGLPEQAGGRQFLDLHRNCQLFEKNSAL